MSYLRDYLEHATGNEAPYMFHVWCGYSVISATASRRVWMCLDDSSIYPNLYILLVGDAGNGKTWSLQKAKRIMKDLDLPVSPSKETVEGMLRHIVGDPKAKPPLPPYGGANHIQNYAWPDGIIRPIHPYNIIASEFIDFIKVDDIGWINTLNNIYDEDFYQYRTKNMGDDFLPGPSITLLGGLTTQVSASMQKDQIINTGLARRTLFQYGERKWNDPHPNPVLTQAQIDARARCLEHLEKVKLVHGQFHWTPETHKWWHDWYCPHLALVPTKPPSTKSWFASKSTQLMKLAMLTSLSERLDLVLEVCHFETALAFLEELEKDLYRIFGGVGSNQLAEVALKIYNFLINQKEPLRDIDIKAKFFHLLQPNNISGSFKDCMTHLVDDQKIRGQTFTFEAPNPANPSQPIVKMNLYYAIPEVMSEFESALAAAKAKQLESSSQREKQKDSTGAAGQLSEPLEAHSLPAPAAPLTSAPPVVGIKIFALPMETKPQTSY